MTRSGLTLWVRVLALALLGLVGQAIAPRPAQAAGCHAQERPVLGLTLSWETPEPSPAPLEVTDDSTPAFVPIPCHGETPGSSARVLPPLGPAALAAGPIAGHAPGLARIEPSPRLRPITIASSLDRPPRRPA